MTRPRAITALASVLLLLKTTSALAQEATPSARAAAVALFDTADRLKSEGHVSEACVKYNESYQLDPQLGALLHLADCLEQDGKLASAYASFRAAAELAQLKNDDRQAMAEERSRLLAPKVSHVEIDVPAANRVAGLEVRCDGILRAPGTWGTSLPMDSGQHKLVVSAPAYEPWETSVTVGSSAAALTVTVPRLQRTAAPPAAAAQPSQPAAESRPNPVAPPRLEALPPAKASHASRPGLRVASYVAGGLGAVGVGLGVVFIARRSDQLATRDGICPTNVCAFGTASESQARISGLTADARNSQTFAAVSFAAGGVLLATAVVLFVASSPGHPKREGATLNLLPALGPESLGLVARGEL